MASTATILNFFENEESFLSRIWTETLSSAIKDVENKDWFSATIGRTNLLRISGNEAVLSVPSEFHGEFIEKDAPTIIEILRKKYPEITKISFEVVIEEEAKIEREQLEKATKENIYQTYIAPIPEESIIKGAFYKNYVFDSFVVCNTNKKAFDLSLTVAEMPGKESSYRILAIYGKSGLGKTHLLQAIGHYASQEKTAKKIFYFSALDFVSQYVNATKEKGGLTEFYQSFNDVDLLLIDDVHLFRGDGSQKAFFDILNYLYDNSRQIVITSDCPPSGISGIYESLKMRLNNCVTAEILVPTKSEKVKIISKKLHGEIALSDDVLSYLAEISTTSVRELEGLYNRLIAASVFCNADLDINSVKVILSNYIKDSRRITADIIIDRVCEYFGITAQEIRSSSRKKEISYPRSIAMYLVRTITENSEQAIGNILGRDHSTVCITCKNITENLKTNKKLESDINSITAIITRQK
ncbi:MAG: chromosomal replication initiator protein DnaA [Chitinispirillales bacterium]|jgi:chromosomal replication initiator protein|nr:chromosomal replication initiator protein DnaA [Chitinispirillales bacterium]